MSVDNVIISARKGDNKSLDELMGKFQGLIISISHRVYNSFGRDIPFHDIQDRAHQIFRELALIEYDFNGKARFPYYAKRILYAKLINEYRPIHRKGKATYCIDDYLNELSVPPEIIKNEKVAIYYKLLKFAEKTFTIRERALIDCCILGDVSHTEMAKRYDISDVRIHQIYSRMIDRLRAYLETLGIQKGDV